MLENVEVKQRQNSRRFSGNRNVRPSRPARLVRFHDASDGVPVAAFRRFGRDRLRLEAQADRLLFRTRPLPVLGRGGQVYVDADVRYSTSLLVGRVMRAYDPQGLRQRYRFCPPAPTGDDVVRRLLYLSVVIL